MSDSKRKQVLDSIVTAVSGISGVKEATLEYKTWWDLPAHKFPHVWIRDVEAELLEVAHTSTDSSWMDKEAVLTVECVGYVHDSFDNLTSKRTNLASDIESTVLSSTGVAAEVLAIDSRRITTDDVTLDNYSMVNITFDVVYHYNHLAP